MTHALELLDVTKRCSGHLAVDRLSLAVPQACIYGILGPHGAGKSTTLRTVMNIIARDGGTIAVLGGDHTLQGGRFAARRSSTPRSSGVLTGCR